MIGRIVVLFVAVPVMNVDLTDVLGHEVTAFAYAARRSTIMKLFRIRVTRRASPSTIT
jgi:hypothetical protein